MPFLIYNMLMNIFYSMLLLSIFFNDCPKVSNKLFVSKQDSIPVVYSNAVFKVNVKKNITYGKGLTHETINSVVAHEMPLKLDIYSPDNSSKNRPVIMLIHGGGFAGGNKEHKHIVSMSKYFASRGWVAISINYRLKKHKGTVPKKWVDSATKIAKERAGQFISIYPAIRDAKAALRWVIANAKMYHVNTNYITVGGGSAGAISAITVGVSSQVDYRDELNTIKDPTLITTNFDKTYKVKTILNFWGGKTGLDILEKLYGKQRFNNDSPPLFIAHGTEDSTVPFNQAEDLKAIYEKHGLPLAYYPLKGMGHGAWGAKVNNKPLVKLAFNFIAKQQNLAVN